MAWPWGRLQRVGAVALGVLSVLFLVARSQSNAVPLILQSGDPAKPRWIMPAARVSAELQQWGRAEVPTASFVTKFDASAPLTLQVRALARFEVALNGVAVPNASGDGSAWRRVSEVALATRPGANELRVDVSNRHGPPLLWLQVDGLEAAAAAVVSDERWRVTWNGSEGPVEIADDTRINPLAYTVETPLRALRDAGVSVATLFALGLLAWFVGRAVSFDRSRLPAIALGAAALGWAYLFVDKFVQIPLAVGFDAKHHLYYVEFLRERGALPLATDGWSVYHPPLFYAAAYLLHAIGSAFGGTAGQIALKLLPFLAGFGNVWVAGALGRRLFPEAAHATQMIVFAAVLPMNVYTAAYFSNETFHTFLAGLVILSTVDLLLAESRASPRQIAVLGALLGLSAITKFTALLVGSVAGFFLLVKWLAVDRERLGRTAAWLGSIGAIAFGIAGWFYVRNWLEYGDPLMANWGSMPGPTLAWWQQPGFHTVGYFASFGESLHHPYLSAFHSFWDGLYSTLWGDGGIAGRVAPLDRPAVWNYRFMSLGYLIALPATLLIGLGVVGAATTALTDRDPRRRAAFSFLLTLSYAVAFGLLYLALRLPYFAQGKASYGLVVTAPLALFFAIGMTTCDRLLTRPGALWAAGRAVLFGWFVVFAAVAFWSFAG